MYTEQGFIDSDLNCADYLSSVTSFSEYQCQEYIDEMFGMDTGFADRRINFLSGGEKKRLEIGAYILQNQDIIILDEPTVSLDEYTVNVLLEMFRNFHGSIIIATHDDHFRFANGFITKTIDTNGNLI